MNFYYIKYDVFSNICIFLTEIKDNNVKNDIQNNMEMIQEKYETKEIITRNNINFLFELIRIIKEKDFYTNKHLRKLFFSIMKSNDIALLKNINKNFEEIICSYFEDKQVDYDKIYKKIDKKIMLYIKKRITILMDSSSSEEEIEENIDNVDDYSTDENTGERTDENADENSDDTMDEDDNEFIKNNNDSLILTEEQVINNLTKINFRHLVSNILLFIYSCGVYMIYKNKTYQK